MAFVLRSLGLVVGSLLFAAILLAHRRWPIESLTYVAMVAMTMAGIVLTRFHLRHSTIKVASSQTAERIIWLVAVLGVGGVQLMTRSLGPQELLGVGFLLMAPLVAQAMLVSALVGPPIALFALTVVSFLLGVSRSLGVELLAASWLAGAVGAHAVNPLRQRSDLLRATTIQVVAQAAIACSATAVVVSDAGIVFESAGWAALAAVGATSLFWLAVTVLERLFGIISDWSLLELCSPDHPLIRELCMRAPGTYAHSVMVGNLAENAARVVGANPIVCRAMAYYHDVGKINRPSYFIENQMGDNLHDDMSPTLSAMVVAAHVKEGLEMAREHHLPKVILDGIAQHHGTTLITYFYHRALEQGGYRDLPDPEFQQLFRYEGPKPQSKECAILHLADSVEAACRTIARGSTEELESMVARVFEDRRADGQLDESDVTLRDLQLIRQSFLRSLSAIRHERIVYPETPPNAPTSQASDLDLQRLAPPTASQAGSGSVD